MQSLTLRSALENQKPAIGFWLTYPSGAVARSILSPGGFNWVLIDAEHGLITDHHYYELCNAIQQMGATPIIRIPNAADWMIKRALDAGAHGVMTPMCNNVEDAKQIVRWSKYPPRGTRGYGPLFTNHSFNTTSTEYDANADKSLIVTVQIETKEGVANVEEIAKVDGIDILFIGPYDLSKFMGVEFGGPEHEAAIEKIRKGAKAAGKTAAIFCTSGGQAKTRLDQGFDMVSLCVDGATLTNAFQKEVAAATGSDAQTKSGY